MTPDPAARWRALADAGAVRLDGFHAVKHALRFGAEIRLALTDDAAGLCALARELAPDLADTLPALVTGLPAGTTLDRVLPRPHPTRVAALAARPDRAANLRALTAADTRRAPVVLLEDPRNLGNLGAVVRLVAGLGATGVATTGDADPWHPAAVRAAAGLHYATVVERLDADAAPPPGPLFVLDPDGGEELAGVRLPDDAVLAFGSERRGLTAALRARADRALALPMREQVSSYNLATSVAMTLYHWRASAG